MDDLGPAPRAVAVQLAARRGVAAGLSLIAALALLAGGSAAAEPPAGAEAERFFESRIRPLLAECTHSYKWDQHAKLREGHTRNAAEVDGPIAGLLTDLKARGMLDDTLVLWASEFGRTPTAQGGDGRDHNPHGFTIWMAGGGVKGGLAHGATDEFGYYATEDRVHMHDLHATILHLLGLDHTRLTYRHAGRDFRLTDVHGRVVTELLR